MKFFLMTFAALLLLLTAATAQDQVKAPRLVIEQTSFDFGKIKEGVKAHHTFTLKNEGKADLIIDSVAPT